VARGVLCCGNLVYDILVRPVDQIRFDATTWVEEIATHLGGNGANTSYALARLGIPTKLIGAVGQDAFGDMVLARLKSVSVDITAIDRTSERTAATVGLVASSGSRAFLHQPGASKVALQEPPRLTKPFLNGAVYFHLANPFAVPALRDNAHQWLRNARDAGLRTSMDLGWDSREQWMEVVGPCLPYTDLLFANREEAQMLTGLENVPAAADALREHGVGTVVVKLGAEGCAVFVPGGDVRVPAFAVDAVDTTGAGDCFAGGFLGGLFYGANLEGAARLANAAGALSVSKLGATEGLLSYKDTLRWMAGQGLRP
jgi:sugar/nucleoside kinase (ribokinase family)